MKFIYTSFIITLSLVLTFSSVAYAEPIEELTLNFIPPEAMQAIDSVNQSLNNRSIPLFDSRALSMGIGALAGVWVYNVLLPSSTIIHGVSTATIGVVTNQLPMMTCAVIGALMADYLYRQSNGVFN